MPGAEQPANKTPATAAITRLAAKCAGDRHSSARMFRLQNNALAKFEGTLMCATAKRTYEVLRVSARCTIDFTHARSAHWLRARGVPRWSRWWVPRGLALQP